jgi:hypothetical protein
MVQGFVSGFCRFYIDFQVFLKGFLPYVIVQTLRTEGGLPGITARFFCRNDAASASQYFFLILPAQAF